MSHFYQQGQDVYNQLNVGVLNKNSYVVHIGKVVQEKDRTTHKIIQMREVAIDLKLSNQSYPTQRWVEKISATGIFADENSEVVNEVWEPENYSYETIKMLLMQEINVWGANGWEVIEHDIDSLWKVEVKRRKTPGSEILGEFIGVLGGLAWKYKRVYYGAKFHVRRIVEC